MDSQADIRHRGFDGAKSGNNRYIHGGFYTPWLLHKENFKLVSASLPTDAQERKATPIYSGCIKYFPRAIAEVARVSVAGAKQHGQVDGMFWDRSKSGDELDPLTRHFAWHVGRTLDFESMSLVAQALVGQHDFGSFCRSVEGRSNIRRVDEASWAEHDGSYEFWIKANAFCHQMVRSIVGHCYDVGRGFASSSDIDEVIRARDRSGVATIAPPHGLTLWEVGY